MPAADLETRVERTARILGPAAIPVIAFAVLVLIHAPPLSSRGKVLMVVGFTGMGLAVVTSVLALVAPSVTGWPDSLALWSTRASAIGMVIGVSVFTWLLVGWVLA
ncbi:MAG TPA: hypothetical protein VK507_16330 [Iamia sp.]|nr:hypothetical protein [Iamia sp.]